MPRGSVTAASVTGHRDRRVGFHTFGCKLNQAETEALASSFRAQGFSVVHADEEADTYVINTCTVTSRADHKARALIRRLARSRPRSLLVVTGCFAQLDAGALSSLGDNVLVIPQAQKANLLGLPMILTRSVDARENLGALGRSAAGMRPDPFALTVREHSFHSRAYLKVQDGCNCRCSYCRVPQARGPSASLKPEVAMRRVAELEELGYREVVVTGVNISAYSSGGVALPRLLRLLLDATRRIRFRLSSIEPESVTPALGEALAHCRICPHFHIPVQSGSDSILGRMERCYRADRVREAAALLRSFRDDPFIAADIIVGFPGETEADFIETRRLIEETSCAALHVFPFSSRPGTRAAVLTPPVPERIRQQRVSELRALASHLSAAYARGWVGREVEVLFEGRGARTVHGVTGNYLKVEVGDVPGAENADGRVARARIISANGRCAARFLGFVD